MLLQLETEEQGGKCMIKWMQNFRQQVSMDQWRCLWVKAIKLQPARKLVQNVSKMVYNPRGH